MPHKVKHVALAVLVVLAGCTTWRATPLSPREVVEGQEPGEIRITLRSGVQLELSDPVVRNDSIVGNTRPGIERRALADVRSVDVRVASEVRTLLLFLGAVPVFVVVYVAASL